MALILKPTMIRYYVNAMTARGYKANSVLSGSGINESQLSSPSLLVDARQSDIVVSNMLRLTGNPALAFDIGGSMRLSDFGILAHAMMSSKTLGEAQRLSFRFYNLMGGRTQLQYKQIGNGGAVTVCDTLDAKDPVRRFYVEEVMMIGIRIGEDLLGGPYCLSECFFAYPAPAYADLYSKRAGCKVNFGSQQNLFIKKESLLRTPLRGNDPGFHEICLRHCKQITRQISSDHPIVAQLQSVVLSKISDIPSLPAAAQILGLSARSLRRHLQQEGTNYQAIIDAIRLDLAKEYLKTEQLQVKEMAGLLGYRSTSTFSRAFKDWTGMTVQQYRNSL